MLSIFICEDDDGQVKSLTRIIENVIMIEDYDMKIELVTSRPHELKEYLSKSKKSAGLYFLDVELHDDKTAGIELAEKIREYDPRGFIAIITGHSQYRDLILDNKIEPLDYIYKGDFDLVPDKIERCVRVAHKRYTANAPKNFAALSIKVDSQVITVEFDKIIAIETTETKKSHTLTLHATDSVLVFHSTLKDIETKLKTDSRFIRVNASCIINAQHLKVYEQANKLVVMEKDLRFFIPTRKTKLFKKAFESALSSQ